MQYALKPLPAFSLQIASVAVGQDHTLALTTSGDVYSWGLNRFSQLGYIVELSSTAAATRHHHEEAIQSTPKRVVGVLRREVVCGVAASKNASACWTKEGVVFTWGTNTGQLGYDRHAQPVQVLPRPVTKFSNAVIDIAMSVSLFFLCHCALLLIIISPFLFFVLFCLELGYGTGRAPRHAPRRVYLQ